MREQVASLQAAQSSTITTKHHCKSSQCWDRQMGYSNVMNEGQKRRKHTSFWSIVDVADVWWRFDQRKQILRPVRTWLAVGCNHPTKIKTQRHIARKSAKNSDSLCRQQIKNNWHTKSTNDTNSSWEGFFNLFIFIKAQSKMQSGEFQSEFFVAP